MAAEAMAMTSYMKILTKYQASVHKSEGTKPCAIILFSSGQIDAPIVMRINLEGRRVDMVLTIDEARELAARLQAKVAES
jgi:hypothetical protein